MGLKTFSFVCTHLHAHQENINDRNKHLMRIIRELVPNEHSDEVFVFGDLNYRMNLTKTEASQFNSLINLCQYIQYDQLKQQVILTDFLKEYQEGELSFPPTYKLNINGEGYNPKRVPGWTDRIFYNSKGKETKQLEYTSDQTVKGSDHSPVLSTFTTNFTRNYEVVR